MSDGNFEQDGRPYNYDILEIVGFDGEALGEGEIDEADQVFYKVEAEWGENEVFYRWLGGPFEHIEDVESAIEDDTDFYA